MTAHDEAALGLRERKKRQTREALSLAAIRLTVERGWDAVTIEDIAAAANVSERTFRNYFSSKAEAFAARHLDRTLLIAEELRARPADEPLWEALTAVVLARYTPESESGGEGGVPRDGRGPEGLRRVLGEPALQAEILRASAVAQEDLARAIAERTGTDLDRDVHPKLIAAAVNAATAVAVDHCLRQTVPVAIAPVLADALAQLARGLSVPRAGGNHDDL